jgi:hypothetical protein
MSCEVWLSSRRIVARDAAMAYRTAWQRDIPEDNLTSAYRALRVGREPEEWGALVDEVTKALSNEVERGSDGLAIEPAVGFADARSLGRGGESGHL